LEESQSCNTSLEFTILLEFCNPNLNGERRYAMGDKGKKDKDKGRKQKINKQGQKAKEKTAKQPRRTP
jgi:hypothetical protein